MALVLVGCGGGSSDTPDPIEPPKEEYPAPPKYCEDLDNCDIFVIPLPPEDIAIDPIDVVIDPITDLPEGNDPIFIVDPIIDIGLPKDETYWEVNETSDSWKSTHIRACLTHGSSEMDYAKCNVAPFNLPDGKFDLLNVTDLHIDQYFDIDFDTGETYMKSQNVTLREGAMTVNGYSYAMDELRTSFGTDDRGNPYFSQSASTMAYKNAVHGDEFYYLDMQYLTNMSASFDGQYITIFINQSRSVYGNQVMRDQQLVNATCYVMKGWVGDTIHCNDYADNSSGRDFYIPVHELEAWLTYDADMVTTDLVTHLVDTYILPN